MVTEKNCFYRKHILFFLILIMLPIPVFAQSEIELITDRPDKTESASTVPAGRLQIETGFEFYREPVDEVSNKNQFNLANSLLRYGLLNEIEIRVGGVFIYEEAESPSEKKITTGPAELMFGIKYNFTKESDMIPNVGLLVHFFLPAGTKNFAPKNAETQAILSVSKNLFESVDLGTNLGTQFNSNKKIWESFYTLVTAILINDKIGTFLEFYSELSKEASSFFSVGTGFTYLLYENFQLDIYLGSGLFNNPKTWFMGSGFSIQL